MKKIFVMLSFIFLFTSCDSGSNGDSCEFSGNWLGVTITTTWSDDSCGIFMETDISCMTMTISNDNMIMDTCECWPDDNCIVEEDFLCIDVTSTDPDDMNCQLEDELFTCISSEYEGSECIQTTTMIFESDDS